jgi:hypothetical protein
LLEITLQHASQDEPHSAITPKVADAVGAAGARPSGRRNNRFGLRPLRIVKVTYPTPNAVSIWVGTFATESEFDHAVEAVVTPSLRLPTELASICEVTFEPHPASIKSLLEGFSGWESFSTAAISAAASRAILSANSALVCYYVGCTDAPEQWDALHFLGTFSGGDT